MRSAAGATVGPLARPAAFAPAPKLVAITDVARFGRALTLQVAAQTCEAALPGSVAILLRDRALPVRERLELAKELSATASAAGQHLLIAGRADLGRLVGARGVHLGALDLPASVLRDTELGHGLWLTAAWHPAAPLPPPAGADALLASPVQEARKGALALGWSEFARAVTHVAPTPVYALGGIGVEQIPRAFGSGAAGIAAIGAFYAQGRDLVAALGIAIADLSHTHT